MGDSIENGGAGPKVDAHVDLNEQLHIFGTTNTEARHALEVSNAYNLNTGYITITATSAMAYLKSDEDEAYIITGIVIGMKTGNVTDMAYAEIIRNPTAGTIVDDETPMTQNSNDDFGSSDALKTTTLAYKGASGKTFTDGTIHSTLQVANAFRNVYDVEIDLGKGSSVGIKLYPDLVSGNQDAYVAFIGYRKDPKNN